MKTLIKMFNRRIALMLGALLVTCAVMLPASAMAQSKIGYVNLQLALNEVDEGKTAKAKLKKDFDKKQKQLDKSQQELQELKTSLESQGMMLTEDVKRQKAMEFQKKMMELQQTYMTLQQELATAEAKATKEIFDKMGKIIDEIAKEGKYDLVLESTESAILYARDDMDLTKELIKRYNAKY